MINTANVKWDLSKEEKYAIQWFNSNGFDGKILKQFVSKTIFEVTKDGITDKFELPQSLVIKDIKGCMEQYKRNWEMFCELHRLRDEKQKICE